MLALHPRTVDARWAAIESLLPGLPLDTHPLGCHRPRRNGRVLLGPSLNAVNGRGLLIEIETLRLDRGYDNNVTRTLCADLGFDDVVCAKKRKRGTAIKKLPVPLGPCWPVGKELPCATTADVVINHRSVN